MKELCKLIASAVRYGERYLKLDAHNAVYARNAIFDALGVQPCDHDGEVADYDHADKLAHDIAAAAVSCGLADESETETVKDKVMGIISLSPSETNAEFKRLYDGKGGKAATDWFYDYCVRNDYVKKSVLDKNPRFEACGLIVTINKAKPEFRDAKKAASGNSVAGGYPKCTICRENEGFGGRNKRTLRTVDIKLNGEDWFWQYSPYGYFAQHGIAVNCEHTPMHIDRSTFYRLMDFVDKFPHYFIGCNAALPRIGGSVLAHDHYQGGGEVLPLQKAPVKMTVASRDIKGVTVGILDWAGTACRIVGKDKDAVATAAEAIRLTWTDHDAPELGIIAHDGDGMHNCVSPTVIKTKDGYEMTVILRSNITSDEYPDGVFHAHPEFHVIKKESIGLIEAQGLFILPGRLESQLTAVEDCISRGKLDDELSEFELVYRETDELVKSGKFDSVHSAMQHELGSICGRILQNTAVFKTDDRMLEFMRRCGFNG